MALSLSIQLRFLNILPSGSGVDRTPVRVGDSSFAAGPDGQEADSSRFVFRLRRNDEGGAADRAAYLGCHLTASGVPPTSRAQDAREMGHPHFGGDGEGQRRRAGAPALDLRAGSF